MINKNSTPPKVFLRFFRWYCHPITRDFIEGDLMEIYERRLKQWGKRSADIRFVLDVLLLFRPAIIKPLQNNRNLNHNTMFRSYFKIGWRNLTRNRSYAAINIAGLALSMTCGILIFTFVTYHLSFDNFHANPDRIYRIVTELHRDNIGYNANVTSPLGEALRSDYNFAEKIARVFTEYNAQITIRKNNQSSKFMENDGVAFAETTFFDIFNFPMLHGDPEVALKNPNSAILTESAARKYFGDKDAIGETFWISNKAQVTVTGILKDFPDNSDLKAGIIVSYSTMKTYDPWLSGEISGWGGLRDGVRCYVLLRPNVSPLSVEAVTPSYVKKFRAKSKNVHHYKLQPLREVHFDSRYGGAMAKQKLWILSIVGLFLIATSCVNFINLATAQALKRSKEVGIRKVLGSLRMQLFWQFIFETAIICMIGISLAIVFAVVIAPYTIQLFDIYIPVNLFPDFKMIGFIVSLGVLVTFLAGYYPALVLARFQPVTALKGKISQQNVGGFNTRRLLIISQFAISQLLIIGMFVVINQMRFAKQSDLGFDKEAIVMVGAGINDGSWSGMKTLKNEIARIPGVEMVSLCFTAPASENDWGNSITYDNNTEETNFRTSIKSADADYLSTFDLELVAGRNLTPSDTAREMMVNEAMVRKLNLPSSDELIGKIISANGGRMKGPVVGVIKDFHDKSFHEVINPILITTSSEDYSSYAVKLNVGEAKSILTSIEKLWVLQHPNEIFQYEFVDEGIARFYKDEDAMLKLIQGFSFISIFIGCLGLYGLVSFMVAQKSKEIGVRKVLGSGVANILWLFWKEFVQLIVIAFLIAAPIGWFVMSKWLQGFQFQVGIGIWVFVSAISFSLMIALLTVGYKVTKAAIMNPVTSLRME